MSTIPTPSRVRSRAVRLHPARLATEHLPGGDWRYPLLLGVVVALAAWPFLAGRYVFFLDLTVGPAWRPLETWLAGHTDPAYGSPLPVFLVLAPVVGLLGAAAAQKVLLVGVLLVTAISGYAVFPGSPRARCYGALLLLVNPFVYARVLVGQWAVVWGLAMLPLVVVTFDRYLERGRRTDLLAAVAVLALLGVSAHLLYAAVLPLAALTLARWVRERGLRPLRRAVTAGGVALVANGYWLADALRGGDPLSSVSAVDVLAYTPSVEGPTALFAAASMHGFWRGGFVTATDLVPGVSVLYVGILVLAVYGAVSHHDDGDRGHLVVALSVTAVVATALATGASGPFAGGFRWLYEHLPLFAGMRDANKFVALLVVALAYLGALGVSTLEETLGGVAPRTLVSVGLALLVALPLAYTFPMVTGYAGQIRADDYPEEWYEVEAFLDANANAEDSVVLFVPWHRYMAYSWLDGGHEPVATPARSFFSAEVIQADNVEYAGVYSASSDPVSRRVESAFGLGPRNGRPADDVAERLASIDVEYVLVTKEADWRAYDRTLRGSPGVRLVHENDHFRVYHNDRTTDGAEGAGNAGPTRTRGGSVPPVALATGVSG